MKRRGWRVSGKRRRRAVPGRQRMAHGTAERPARMAGQIVVCGALFVALVGLKLMMPGHLSELRGTLGEWLVRDADFVSAFSAVGRAAAGEQAWGASLSEACAAVFGGEGGAKEVSGELAGVTVPEQDVSGFVSERALPAQAVGEQRILGFAYACPLAGEMTSPFGWREDPVSGEERFHYGVDIAGAEGAAVSCFADGSVGTVGESALLGNYVTVNHDLGFSTLYAHCSAIAVSAGQRVQKGEVIASVGATGNATGPHLHFEVHDGGQYLNPIYYVVS